MIMSNHMPLTCGVLMGEQRGLAGVPDDHEQWDAAVVGSGLGSLDGRAEIFCLPRCRGLWAISGPTQEAEGPFAGLAITQEDGDQQDQGDEQRAADVGQGYGHGARRVIADGGSFDTQGSDAYAQPQPCSAV
jgi:hypothetical protein